jgi:hypothetical protein
MVPFTGTISREAVPQIGGTTGVSLQNDNSDLKSDTEMVAADSIYHEIPSDDDRLGDNEQLG